MNKTIPNYKRETEIKRETETPLRQYTYEYRKDNMNNNSKFNSSEIDHILLPYHTAISLVVLVLLSCHYLHL